MSFKQPSLGKLTSFPLSVSNTTEKHASKSHVNIENAKNRVETSVWEALTVGDLRRILQIHVACITGTTISYSLR